MEAGYNNILKLATGDMRFGKNDDVNYSETQPQPSSVSKKPSSANKGPERTSEIGNVASGEPSMFRSELDLLALMLLFGGAISKFLI